MCVLHSYESGTSKQQLCLETKCLKTEYLTLQRAYILKSYPYSQDFFQHGLLFIIPNLA